ncbi:MAG: DUF551 domain-containing protein [Deinococcota bacterium]
MTAFSNPISIKDQLPESNQPKLVWDGTEWVRGKWIASLSVPITDEDMYDGFHGRLDPETGINYMYEGWYELIGHLEGYEFVSMWGQDKVTHWIDLPPSPT